VLGGSTAINVSRETYSNAQMSVQHMLAMCKYRLTNDMAKPQICKRSAIWDALGVLEND
jgi:hypothetical protein